MSDARELYQEMILDHSRQPRNFKKLEGADRVAEGDNPLCGDEVTVYLRLDGEVVTEIAFEGQGCAISKASASIMTTAVKGKSRDEAERLFEGFHAMVTGDGVVDPEKLGKLQVFRGVREFPARVKCASLAWHTLHAALAGEKSKATTEGRA